MQQIQHQASAISALEKRLSQVERERDAAQQTNSSTVGRVDILHNTVELIGGRVNDAVDGMNAVCAKTEQILGQQAILQSLNLSLKSIAESLEKTRASFSISAKREKNTATAHGCRLQCCQE